MPEIDRKVRKRRKDARLTPAQQAEIAQRYVAGESNRHLAEEFGVSPSVISGALRHAGVPSISGTAPKVGYEHDAEIVADRAAGMALEEIAQKWGISVRSVLTRLRKNGVERGDWCAPPDDRYIGMFREGMSVSAIAQAYGHADHKTVARWLEVAGVRERQRIPGMPEERRAKLSRPLTAEQRERIVALYREGYGVDFIAATVGCTSGTAKTYVTRAGIQLRRPGQHTEVSERYRVEQTRGLKRSRETRERMAEGIARSWDRIERGSSLEEEVAAALDRMGIRHRRQVHVRVHKGDRSGFVFPDFLVGGRDVLEVYGTYMHCDPRAYPNGPVAKPQEACILKDQQRLAQLSRAGYTVAILWEIDFKKDPDSAISNALGRMREAVDSSA